MKKLKAVGLVAAVAVFMVAASGISKADDIQIGGLVSFAPTSSSNCASPTTGCQSVTFSNLTVLATNPSESINPSTTSVSFPTFDLGFWGSAATFNPMSGALSVSINGQTLTGNIAWENLVATGSGGFQLDVSLNGLTGGGTDSVLGAFAAHGQGSGILTFQFTAGSLNSDQALVDSKTGLSNNSLSATLSTPEPASLGLFGIGLLALAFVYRRRLKALA